MPYFVIITRTRFGSGTSIHHHKTAEVVEDTERREEWEKCREGRSVQVRGPFFSEITADDIKEGVEVADDEKLESCGCKQD